MNRGNEPEFHSEMILVSAGFDWYVDDPERGRGVTSEGCAAMTRVVIQVADTCSDGKQVQGLLINCLFNLYWGYGINKGFLAGSGLQHLSGFTILYHIRS